MGFKKPNSDKFKKGNKPVNKRVKKKSSFSLFGNKKKKVVDRNIKEEEVEVKISEKAKVPDICKIFLTDVTYNKEDIISIKLLETLPNRMESKVLKPYCKFNISEKYLSELDESLLKLYKDREDGSEELNIATINETIAISREEVRDRLDKTPTVSSAPKKSKSKFTAL